MNEQQTETLVSTGIIRQLQSNIEELEDQIADKVADKLRRMLHKERDWQLSRDESSAPNRQERSHKLFDPMAGP